MKGIVLAGGSGSRLYPMTSVISKQLLPVYDKPMICYPLSTLMLMGISDILIISTPQDTPTIKAYLGDGEKYGVRLSYCVQDKPNGIAEAFLLAEDFLKGESVCMILGDNIFHIGEQIYELKQQASDVDGALIVGYHVSDPERFGVISFEKGSSKVAALEEKPKNPKSNYAAVGLYAYSGDVVAKAKALKPSPRGELEITDLNNVYLAEGRLEAVRLRRGAAWLDAGTPTSLLEASEFVAAVDKRQGLKIACLEEVAVRMGYISLSQLQDIVSQLKDGSDYKKYLAHVVAELA